MTTAREAAMNFIQTVKLRCGYIINNYSDAKLEAQELVRVADAYAATLPQQEERERFSSAQALCILKVRDALLAKDIEEAYHWLYTLDSKQTQHDPFNPWAELERIAAPKGDSHG